MKRPVRVQLFDNKMIGEDFVEHLPVDERRRVIKAVRRAFELGATESIEYRDLDNNWWHVNVVPVEQSAQAEKVAIVCTDITKRKRAEQELIRHQKRLRSLASESSLAEEKERKRISTELHDRIGQPLLALKLMMGSLRKSINAPEFAKSMDEMQSLLSHTIEDTRALTFELSPQILYILGFEAAVEWLIDQSEKRYGFPFVFRCDGRSKPLDDDLQVFLFQAIRELLRNAGKHAKASRVAVSINSDAEKVSVRVSDNGIGFDVFRIDHFKDGDKDFGLFSIRERLYHLGGSFRITSTTGRGTTIMLDAPLKATEKKRHREIVSI